MPKQLNQPTNKLIKIFLIFLGIVSLCLGIIGILLPLLPTTPFLLLSAALFLKSSKKLYNWLINHKYLGIFIQNYLHHKTIPLRTKVSAISLLWITIFISIIFVVEKIILKVLLLAIAGAVTWHILSFKSNKE